MGIARKYVDGLKKLIMGLFDRIFIDWYWVGKTKTWIMTIMK